MSSADSSRPLYPGPLCCEPTGTVPVVRRAHWLREPGQTVRSHFGDVGFSRIISLRLRWFRLKCIKITYCLIPAVRPELTFRCSRGCMVPDCPAEGVTASFSVVQVRPPALVMLVMAAVLRAHQSVPVSRWTHFALSHVTDAGWI